VVQNQRRVPSLDPRSAGRARIFEARLEPAQPHGHAGEPGQLRLDLGRRVDRARQALHDDQLAGPGVMTHAARAGDRGDNGGAMPVDRLEHLGPGRHGAAPDLHRHLHVPGRHQQSHGRLRPLQQDDHPPLGPMLDEHAGQLVAVAGPQAFGHGHAGDLQTQAALGLRRRDAHRRGVTRRIRLQRFSGRLHRRLGRQTTRGGSYGRQQENSETPGHPRSLTRPR
jgi:hypothetical protein